MLKNNKINMKQVDGISKLFDVKNRNIVITGSSGLLGSQYANTLSAAGANIILVDLDSTKNKKLEYSLVKKYRTKARSYIADISNFKEVTKLAQNVLRDFKKIILAYHAVHPPSTIKLAPVIYEEASEIKNNIAPLYSSFLAILPKIVLSEYFLMNFLSWYVVSRTPPGESVFTLIFFPLQYAAKYLVKLTTAPFVAA